jgi:hypothetical protein
MHAFPLPPSPLLAEPVQAIVISLLHSVAAAAANQAPTPQSPQELVQLVAEQLSGRLFTLAEALSIAIRTKCSADIVAIVYPLKQPRLQNLDLERAR